MLVDRVIEGLGYTYTKEGELILDNTMGSGTTGVAAINLKRTIIVIERELEYFNIAKERLDEAVSKKEVS